MGEELVGSSVAEGLAGADGAVSPLPALEFLVELGDLERAGDELKELLRVGALGTLEICLPAMQCYFRRYLRMLFNHTASRNPTATCRIQAKTTSSPRTCSHFFPLKTLSIGRTNLGSNKYRAVA
jgi:hypothetical protein